MVDTRVVRAFERLRQAAVRGDPEPMLAALTALEAAVRAVRRQTATGLVLDRGWSYSQLGRALGVTRQAAHKTFAPEVGRVLHARVRSR